MNFICNFLFTELWYYKNVAKSDTDFNDFKRTEMINSFVLEKHTKH